MPENPSLSSVGMNGIHTKSCLQNGGIGWYNPMHENDRLLERSSYETQIEISPGVGTEISEASTDRETRGPLENPAGGGGRSKWMEDRGTECDAGSHTYVGTNRARTISFPNSTDIQGGYEQDFAARVYRVGGVSVGG